VDPGARSADNPAVPNPGRLPAVLLLAAAASAAAAGACGSERAERRNLLVVTIDTLRRDAVGFHGGPATPTLDALAAEALVCEDALTVAPVTLPAHASLFTGMPPAAHGVHDNGTQRVSEAALMLAEILRDRGFHTAGFPSAEVLGTGTGIEQGFVHFDASLDRPADLLHVPERSAEAVTARAVEHLSSIDRSKPFFLWVHYFDPHAPYSPPQAFQQIWRQRTRQNARLRNETPDELAYRGEIEYVDSQLSHLFGNLRALELVPLVVLTADHGEALGDHGEITHGTFLYQSTVHVPLLFLHPSLRPQRCTAPVGLVDVLPTILELLQVPQPAPVPGRSLVPLFESGSDPSLATRTLLIETYRSYHEFGWSWLQALRIGPQKYIDAPRPELYDLAADAFETRNLVADDAASSGPYRARLTETLAALGRDALAPEAVSPEEFDQLASLGYLTLQRDVPASRDDLADPKDHVHLLAIRDQALQWMALGRFDQARAAARTILEQNPDPAPGTLLMALAVTSEVQMHAGEPVEPLLEESAGWWTQMIELAPGNLFYRHNLAMTEFRRGRFDAGLTQLEACEAIAPEDAETLLQLGQEHSRRSNTARARTYLERARDAFAAIDSARAAYAAELLAEL
jgi:arylsulfatase A-like enzyme